MNNIWAYINNIRKYNGALYIILGIVLLLFPNSTVSLIVRAIGFMIVVSGITNIINYYNSYNWQKNTIDIVIGLILIIAGLYMVSNPYTIISILPFIMGIWFIYQGIIRIQRYYINHNKGYTLHTNLIISAVLMIVVGIFIIGNKLTTMAILIRIIGFFLLLYGCSNIIESNYYNDFFN